MSLQIKKRKSRHTVKVHVVRLSGTWSLIIQDIEPDGTVATCQRLTSQIPKACKELQVVMFLPVWIWWLVHRSTGSSSLRPT